MEKATIDPFTEYMTSLRTQESSERANDVLLYNDGKFKEQEQWKNYIRQDAIDAIAASVSKNVEKEAASHILKNIFCYIQKQPANIKARGAISYFAHLEKTGITDSKIHDVKMCFNAMLYYFNRKWCKHKDGTNFFIGNRFKPSKKIVSAVSDQTLRYIANNRNSAYVALINVGASVDQAIRYSRVLGKMLENEYIEPAKIDKDYVYRFMHNKNLNSPIKFKTIGILLGKIKRVMSIVYSVNIDISTVEIFNYLSKNVIGFKEKQLELSPIRCFKKSSKNPKKDKTVKQKIQKIREHIIKTLSALGYKRVRAVKYATLIGNLLSYKYIHPTKLNDDMILKYIVSKTSEKPIMADGLRSLLSKTYHVMFRVYGVKFNRSISEIIIYLAKNVKAFREK